MSFNVGIHCQFIETECNDFNDVFVLALPKVFKQVSFNTWKAIPSKFIFNFK